MKRGVCFHSAANSSIICLFIHFLSISGKGNYERYSINHILMGVFLVGGGLPCDSHLFDSHLNECYIFMILRWFNFFFKAVNMLEMIHGLVIVVFV